MLIDTNILLRSVQPTHAMHLSAVRALNTLLNRGNPLYIAIQNVAEFWNAATRPAAHNGLGWTVEKAKEEVDRLGNFFRILTEDSSSYSEWKTLETVHRVVGAQVHDARLAAVMKSNGISSILTFNVSDFTRFPGIEAVHPEQILVSSHVNDPGYFQRED